MTCREEPSGGDPSQAICIAIEFDSPDEAERASAELFEFGEHVEGPCENGEQRNRTLMPHRWLHDPGHPSVLHLAVDSGGTTHE